MNANHERWKALEAARSGLGGSFCRAVHACAKRRGSAYTARKLRERGIGLAVARALILGRL